jgi:hypothetical protein
MIVYPAISPLTGDRHAPKQVIGMTGLGDRHRPDSLAAGLGLGSSTEVLYLKGNPYGCCFNFDYLQTHDGQ